jgi:carbohydrate-binding DOMON domain-containing protein
MHLVRVVWAKPIMRSMANMQNGYANLVESGSFTAVASATSNTTGSLTAGSTTKKPTRIIETTSATSLAAAAQETAGKECHTHSDGTQHCFKLKT